MLNRVRRWSKEIVGAIVFLAAAFTVLDNLLKWGVVSWLWIRVGRLADLLATHWVASALVVYAVLLFVLYVNVYRLQRYVGTSFKDDFRKDLNGKVHRLPTRLSPRPYRRRKGGDTWHFCKNCSTWPITDYVEQVSKPTTGELCNACLAKEKAGNCL